MLVDQLLRQYGRSIVRGFGFLVPSHPSGLSFSKVHALIELGEQGPINAKQLGEALCLEKSSVSRLVQSLLKQELLRASANKADERSILLDLTQKGRQKLEEINHHADGHIHSVLNFLTPAQQKQVEIGLKQYATALTQERLNQQINFRPINPEDDKNIETVSRIVLAEYNANREGFAFTDSELENMYSVFSQTGWYYLVCEKDNSILGGCGLGPLKGASSEYCEVKKMYLSADSRGLGLGKYLLNKIIEKARELGYKYCYLETLRSMEAANNLYLQFGFEQLVKPLGNTGHFGCDRWYLLAL